MGWFVREWSPNLKKKGKPSEKLVEKYEDCGNKSNYQQALPSR